MFNFESAMNRVKSFVPTMRFGDDQERLSFAKFGHGSDETEMSSIRVRRVSSEETDGGMDQCTDLGGGLGTAGHPDGDMAKINGMTPAAITRMDSLPAGEKTVTDQISEWQAGWNVTNAIQVRLHSTIKSLMLHAAILGGPNLTVSSMQ